jgi:hypothetical protein
MEQDGSDGLNGRPGRSFGAKLSPSSRALSVLPSLPWASQGRAVTIQNRARRSDTGDAPISRMQELRPASDVVEHAEAIEQEELLERKAQPPRPQLRQLPFRHGGGVLPGDTQQHSARGLLQGAHHMQWVLVCDPDGPTIAASSPWRIAGYCLTTPIGRPLVPLDYDLHV